MSSMNLLTGRDAPDFSLSDSAGKSVTLASLQGMPAALIFYTENCTWCRSQMPRLAEVYRRLNNVDVRIIGVLVGEADAVRSETFAREHELDFPILLDADREVCSAYQITRVPTIVVVDGEGKITRIYEGATEQLAGIVEQTMLAAAGRHQLPEYSMVGNGCSPEG